MKVVSTVFVNKGETKMIAHRGCSALETENTAAAFVAAGNRSYYGIETDVHVTKDGKFIVIHDDNLLRIAGIDGVTVEEIDFDTLRGVHLFDTRTDRWTSKGHPILEAEKKRADLVPPSLEEYIDICKKYGKIAVLELKNRMEKEDIARILATIEAMEYLENVIFISFSFENMLSIKQLRPEQPVQFLIGKEGILEERLPEMKKYKMDLDIAHTLLTKELVDALHAEGIRINVWTVGIAADAEKYAAWGVDYITTNNLE